MKKFLVSSFILVLYLTLWPTISNAGTFMVGAKGWYASWDSAILDWFEQDIAIGFRENRLTLTADSDPGEGYLAGPLFGYQTSDGKWSFSFAPMVFSSFSQDWHGTAGSMVLTSDVDLERKDFDLAASYTLTKYLKVFFGYKFQDMDLDFTLSYDTLVGPQTFRYKVESMVHIPTVGVGGVYPLSEKFVTGLQLGVLYAIPELNLIKIDTGEVEDIEPWPSLGFNGEATATYQLFESFIVQLGYRYQVFTLEARGPGRVEKTKSYDITHGAILSAVYVF